MTAKWIQTNGKVSPVRPVNGTDFQVQELMHYCGGYFRAVRVKSAHGALLVVNEDGHVLRLPFNPIASQLHGELIGIAGNALLCLPDQIK